MKLVIGMIALLFGPLPALAQEPAPVEQRLVEVLPAGWIHDGVVVTPGGAQLYFQSLFNRPGAYPHGFVGDTHRTYAVVWTLTQNNPLLAKHERAVRQARIAPIGARWQVIVDGQKGKSYQHILDGSLTLSPNNARLAYVARDVDGWRAIVSGIEGPPAAEVSAPIFSPDSRHVVYIAGQDGKYWIVRDGKIGKAFSDIIEASLTFSASSDHLAYVAREGKQYVMVLDGRLGPRYDQIGPPVFSPDGKHLAYAARQGKRWLVVRDGAPGPPMDYAWGPVFSADGLRLAYVARVGRKARVVVDGKPGKLYDAVYNYQFSPNGKRLAYVARDDKRFFAVIDGAEGKVCSRIPTARPCLRFSPDSMRVAYVAHNAGADFMVVNGVESERFDFIEGPVFSPDSRRLAYVVCQDGKAFMVIDGQPEPTFQAVGMPAFSPDGRQVAYTAKLAGQWSLSVAETEGPPYGFILNPSSDAGIELASGAHDQLTYRVEVPVNRQWAIFQYVMPAHLAPEHQGGISWVHDGKRAVLRYLAVKNGAIYWVEKPAI
jgi:Tol biopolymer transport system component